MSVRKWIHQLQERKNILDLYESHPGMDNLVDDWNSFRKNYSDDVKMQELLDRAEQIYRDKDIGQFISVMQQARQHAQRLAMAKESDASAKVESETNMNEKAVSKSQQRAAGIALAAKRGEIPKSELRGASKEMAKMSTKDLEDFASTEHKGLPKKVKKK